MDEKNHILNSDIVNILTVKLNIKLLVITLVFSKYDDKFKIKK